MFGYLTVQTTDNPRGGDPVQALFALIAAQYPAVNLTVDTGVIRLLQHHSHRLSPNRTRLVISPKDDLSVKHTFLYNRFQVQHAVSTRPFTTAELPSVTTLSNEALLQALAVKTNLNLTPKDFFIDPGITYTGGSVGPNWRLKARPDSMFWHGETIIQLHG